MPRFNPKVDPLDFAIKLREFINYLNSGSSTNKESRQTLPGPSFQPGNMPSFGDFSRLNEYIRETINQSFSQHLGSMFNQPSGFPFNFSGPADNRNAPSDSMNETLKTQVFETHEMVIVRVGIPEHINERLLRIRTGTNKLIIRWGPDKDNQLTIQLPAVIKSDDVSASIKEHVLEVKMPKESEPHLRDIDINRS
ncbi:MAG: Hsp20/alpha crystallin family protein [Bacillota bacterium]